MSWPARNRNNVWVKVTKELKDTLSSEFQSIVGMENFGITNETKHLLEFLGNQICLFPWQSTDMGQPSGMILESHHPTHQHAKWIAFPELAKVDEINLESFPEVLKDDWLDRPLNLCCNWIFLQAREAGHAVMLDIV
jgi:hypothetical protein